MSRAGTGVLHEVRREIRQRICSGVWPPGTQLPTRDALAQLFDASPSTIQLAIRGLVEDGSMVTRKRGGAHVAKTPPESCRYALVLGDHALRTTGNPTYFLDCMAAATGRIAELRPGWRMDCAQASDQHLAESMRRGALAGILYFGPPQWILGVAGVDIPLATFFLPDHRPWATVNIPLDNHVLLQSSLRSHLMRGRKRIAILDNGGLMTNQSKSRPLCRQFQHLADAVRKAGGMCEPTWIHCVDPCTPVVAYQTTLLLLDRPRAHRPNALVLLDDHLLPPVLAAIKRLGLRIPTDLSVSVQAHHLPVGPTDNCIRLGFDVATFMVEIVDLLAKARRGFAVPLVYHLRIDELGGPPDSDSRLSGKAGGRGRGASRSSIAPRQKNLGRTSISRAGTSAPPGAVGGSGCGKA